MKVLVSDPLSEVGVKIFQETQGIEVDVHTGLTPDELKKIIGAYDGLVIRSATRVTADIIEQATNLKVIGRAGIGLDNVDIPAASQRGIVVMNTPDGNTITTAEHTIAMIFALSRHIPQATASLKEGKWEKKKFKGKELFNKTLGLVGLGHIGRIVAERAKGLQMKVIVFDPYIKPENAEKMDIEPVSLEDLLKRSDIITVHTPKTPETTNLINKEAISKMKKGVLLINCARGGIMNEDDVCEGLRSGHVGGAAFDVFSTEPPGKIDILTMPNFICTPHLGASTTEAQDNVAVDVANQIVAYLLHGTIKNAVNVPGISAELMTVLRPYAVLVERMGLFHAQLADSAMTEVRVEYSGDVTQYDPAPLTTAALKGLLTPILKDDVNFINAPHVAADRGIKVVESKSKTSQDFSSLIKITVKTLDGENIISGTVFGANLQRILRINDFYLEAIPEGHNLFIHNLDKPGAIAQIATILGKNMINISRMQVGQQKEKQQNVILLTTSQPVGEEVIKEIKGLENVFSARKIEL